jgi:hypothetical protein
LSLADIQNIKFNWFGASGQQRREIIATLNPANVMILIQFKYDGSLALHQSTDGGSTWQNIWVK